MSRHNLYLHWITATRFRKPLIGTECDLIMRKVATEVALENSAQLAAFGSWHDHAHFVHRVCTGTDLRRLIGQTKSRITNVLRDNGIEDFSWQRGSWGETVSRRGIFRVVAYVENQRHRHAARGTGLRQELRVLGLDDDEVDFGAS